MHRLESGAKIWLELKENTGEHIVRVAYMADSGAVQDMLRTQMISSNATTSEDNDY